MGLQDAWEGEEMELPWLRPVRTPEPKKITALVKDSKDAEYINNVFMTRGVPQIDRKDLRGTADSSKIDATKQRNGYYGLLMAPRNNNMYFNEYMEVDADGGNVKKWEIVSQQEHDRQTEKIRQKKVRESNKDYIIDFDYF
eukprot:GHVS01081462.1.p1 GENE.GHVS01081462.1~~GHVS01081462.1.p1  ORF type:complete len:156 (-),score=31.07 GHVS01081462.1:161-583(-)